jgi:RsiW-degrading membrane proteinase PrsW (M82 family)
VRGLVPILLLASSVLPAVLLFLWVYFRDRIREPASVVLATIGLGVLIALPAYFIEDLLVRLGILGGILGDDDPASLLKAGYMSFAVAGLVEESLKFMVLWGFAARRVAFDEPIDGIVYGAAVSLGFAGIENALYVMNAWTADDGSTAASATLSALRAFTAVPMHAAFGVVMGACIGIAHFTPARRALWLGLGLAGAIGLHGFYNLAVSSIGIVHFLDSGLGVGMTVLGMLTVMGAGAMVSVLALARLRRDQEVAMAGGRLPPVVAPRLPMTTAILSAASVGCSSIAVSAAFALERGGRQQVPMGPVMSGSLEAIAVGVLAFSAACAVAAVPVGIAALALERRWRATSIAAVLVALAVGSAAVFVVLAAVAAAGSIGRG